jgi:glycosyltransferase involved in cell wall biosynthesis
MRLIFFYTALGQASPGSNIPWDPAKQTNNRFAVGFQEEGYYWLIKRMLETGIIDECLVFVESCHNTGSREYMTRPPFRVYVAPEITAADKYIKPGDIIWVRGGFRTWHDYLVDLAGRRHWLLLYAANTGRARWPFWDVILDDLPGCSFVDGAERIHLDFRKPTHEGLFYPVDLEQEWDLCIGASFIHDKKGQWRAINALIEHERITGYKLHCIMPGAERRGVMTTEMFRKIADHKLDVTFPGCVSRSNLNRIYNSSKIFVHLGSHGQGDRGPIEAMRCGCRIIIGYPKYHAPWTGVNNPYCCVARDPDNRKSVAANFQLALEQYTPDTRQKISSYHEAQAGVETMSLGQMKELFEAMIKCESGKTAQLAGLMRLE